MSANRSVEWSLGASGPVLTPIEDSIPWQDAARCAEVDPAIFFPEKGGSTREAKRICRGCDVRAECLDYAIENQERFGIWGGLSERERRHRKRETGRPVRSRPASAPRTTPAVTRAERDAAIADRIARGEKDCPRCETPKPFSDFSRSSKSPDGHATWCKVCVLAYQRENRDGLSVQDRTRQEAA
jgi:WhiB family redox-sensing transcriptional regulator